jgi:hypothetical protein
MILSAAAFAETAPALPASADEADSLPAVPLDDDDTLDFAKLAIFSGVTSADNVPILNEPDGESLLKIKSAGTVVYIFDNDDPEWYRISVKFDDYIITGYIKSSDITSVKALSAFGDVTDVASFALALRKAYDITALTEEHIPDDAFPGLYQAIVDAKPVFISKAGAKYHYNPTCSNMKNPLETTIAQAIATEKEACKKCVKE